jgi:hypothetical protein
MNLEIFKNRNNSLPHYIEYLTKLASIKLESAANGEKASMVEYNQVSLILQDLCEVSVKQQEELIKLFNENK